MRSLILAIGIAVLVVGLVIAAAATTSSPYHNGVMSSTGYGYHRGWQHSGISWYAVTLDGKVVEKIAPRYLKIETVNGQTYLVVIPQHMFDQQGNIVTAQDILEKIPVSSTIKVEGIAHPQYCYNTTVIKAYKIQTGNTIYSHKQLQNFNNRQPATGQTIQPNKTAWPGPAKPLPKQPNHPYGYPHCKCGYGHAHHGRHGSMSWHQHVPGQPWT